MAVDLLPVLCHRVDQPAGDVRVTTLIHLGFIVFGERTQVRGVPVVTALDPRQFRGEGREKVVKSPAEDDVVVTVEEKDDDAGSQTDACNDKIKFR